MDSETLRLAGSLVAESTAASAAGMGFHRFSTAWGKLHLCHYRQRVASRMPTKTMPKPTAIHALAGLPGSQLM